MKNRTETNLISIFGRGEGGGGGGEEMGWKKRKTRFYLLPPATSRFKKNNFHPLRNTKNPRKMPLRSPKDIKRESFGDDLLLKNNGDRTGKNQGGEEKKEII